MARKLMKTTGTSESEIFAELYARFADKDEAAKALACKLCEQAAFMQVTLAELAERIRREGAVIVTKNGNQYFVLGYPVLLDDTYAYSEAILGDWSTVYGNMPLNATVRSSFSIDTNSYKYLGVAMFDCKPTKDDAFVKVVKSA